MSLFARLPHSLLLAYLVGGRGGGCCPGQWREENGTCNVFLLEEPCKMCSQHPTVPGPSIEHSIQTCWRKGERGRETLTRLSCSESIAPHISLCRLVAAGCSHRLHLCGEDPDEDPRITGTCSALPHQAHPVPPPPPDFHLPICAMSECNQRTAHPHTAVTAPAAPQAGVPQLRNTPGHPPSAQARP